MQQTQQITPEKFLRTIKIIHFAMFVVPIGLAAMMYSEITTTIFELTDTNNSFQYLIPIAAILSVFIGNYLFNKQISIAKTKDTLLEKLTQYQTGSIIKYSLLEGVSIFGIIGFLDNGNLFYLTVSGILLLYLILQKPTKLSIESALDFTSEQRRQFNKLDEVIE